MSILIRQPGLTAVQPPAEIDWTNPLSFGLQVFIVPGIAFRDFAGAQNLGTGTSMAYGISPYGPHASFANTGNIDFTNSVYNGDNMVGNSSIFALVNFTDYSNYRGVVGKTNSNKPNPYDIYADTTTGNMVWARGDGAGVSIYNSGVHFPQGPGIRFAGREIIRI